MLTLSAVLLLIGYFSSKNKWQNPATGKVSSHFGTRWGKLHNGTDIELFEGTPVYAPAAGDVVADWFDGESGNALRIKHDNTFSTGYAHLSLKYVKLGDKVKKGQLIAKSGNTGASTGPHLHFVLQKNNVVIDPVESGLFKTKKTAQGITYFV